ncbi:hypothetical protein T261_8290 [Streptomyces lydicus]|nr:hypothetical protein T261_8290 [Streptomyces lydicus]
MAARESRSASNDAAKHAEPAAKAADKAADEAGRAVDAAKESTAAADVATKAANDAQTADGRRQPVRSGPWRSWPARGRVRAGSFLGRTGDGVADPGELVFLGGAFAECGVVRGGEVAHGSEQGAVHWTVEGVHREAVSCGDTVVGVSDLRGFVFHGLSGSYSVT